MNVVDVKDKINKYHFKKTWELVGKSARAAFGKEIGESSISDFFMSLTLQGYSIVRLNFNTLAWKCKSKKDDSSIGSIHELGLDEKHTLCGVQIEENWYIWPGNATDKLVTCRRCKELIKKNIQAMIDGNKK